MWAQLLLLDDIHLGRIGDEKKTFFQASIGHEGLVTAGTTVWDHSETV